MQCKAADEWADEVVAAVPPAGVPPAAVAAVAAIAAAAVAAAAGAAAAGAGSGGAGAAAIPQFQVTTQASSLITMCYPLIGELTGPPEV